MAAVQRVKKIFTPHIITPVLFGLIFILILLRCLFTLDPDFGWHISSGQYILANGLPQTDIYTYTAADFPWIHHEWLADVINAAMFNLGGIPLLAVFFTALWTLAIWLMAGKQNWKGAVVVLIAVIAMAQFVAIRDTAYTALLLAIAHRLYDKARVYIPLLFIVWANLHGGFMIGFAYILWRVLYERRWQEIWIAVVAFAATLINPYGPNLYREIFATLLDPTLHTKINEWQRMGINATLIILPIVWLVPIVHDLYKNKWRGIVQFDVYLLLASLLSLRHFMLFSLFSLPRITAFYSQLSLPKWRPPKKVFALKRIFAALGIQIAGLSLLTLFIASCVTALQGPLQFAPEESQPVTAVKSLQNAACKGNIFNDYDIGGYLIWKYPEQKIYIDGRMPSWHYNGTNYMADYLKITQNDDFQKQHFNTHHITCAIVKNDSRLATSLKKLGWRSEVDYNSGWTLLRK